MTTHIHTSQFEGHWKGIDLPTVLAGDVAAAGLSATLISPLITAIDRYVRLLDIASIV